MVSGEKSAYRMDILHFLISLRNDNKCHLYSLEYDNAQCIQEYGKTKMFLSMLLIKMLRYISPEKNVFINANGTHCVFHLR